MDEEKNIERCLEEVKWADEIIVVDAISSDKTPEIASRYTDKVISRNWVDFFDQRSFALRQAVCDFVLILDADEVLDKEAQDEIKKILASKETSDGYLMMRDTYFLGKRLLFSEKPDPIMRLFKRQAGFVATKPGQKAHENYNVNGDKKLIRGRLRHYTSNTITDRLKKTNRYSTAWADERVKYYTQSISSIKAIYVTVKSFIGNFFVRGGLLDGFIGFIWCVLKASENFINYAKLYIKTNAN